MKWPSFISLAAVASHTCSASTLKSRQAPDPPTNNFVRRADAAATVLDDYLYVVGGGVAVHLPGDNADSETRVAGLNVTLALSLKEDWQARDAEFKTIPADDFPTAIGHALWANKDDKEIVFWGGKDFASDQTGSSNPKIWTLTADGNGGGKWTSKEPPSNIRRAAFGGYTECGGKGYFVGGYGEGTTDGPAFTGNRIAVPGLISYDFNNGTFRNESTEGLTDTGAFQKGSAVCVTLPGQDPKLFVLGGAEPQLTEVADNNVVGLQSFDNAFFYDLKKQKWFKQETQGSRPTARQGTCAVGAQGPNGTYEIFMYGGFRDGGGPMDDAWVLSIPAFRWFRVDAKSDTRYSHACARVGSQMIVVGGNDNPVWNKKDPFPKGLGIFNLNSLEWKDTFEADAAKYESPSVVRTWYNERGHDTIPWGSDEIKEAFLSTDNVDGDGTSDPEPTSTPDTGSSTSAPTGAIAGGVVAGVLGLTLVGAAIWWWRKRKNEEPREPINEADDSFAFKGHEMDSGYMPSELSSPATERIAESRSGNKRFELDARHSAVELPA